MLQSIYDSKTEINCNTNEFCNPLNAFERASDLVAAGISVIPLKTTDPKIPAGEWKIWQTKLPSVGVLEEYFLNTDADLGIVCGSVSGNLTALDFDEKAQRGIYQQWKDWIPASLLDRLPIVKTPTGGFHVLFRSDSVFPNVGTAFSATGDKIIELKSEGGYIVAFGKQSFGEYKSIGKVSPLNTPWITAAEATYLIEIAIEQNDFIHPEKPKQQFTFQHFEVDDKFLPPLEDRIIAASRYLAACPGSIGKAGQNAIGTCFNLACKLVWDFALPEEEAIELLMDWGEKGTYSDGTSYPWTEHEITQKIRGALTVTHKGIKGNKLIDSLIIMENQVNQMLGVDTEYLAELEFDKRVLATLPKL